MVLTIVILNFNTAKLLEMCLKSIFEKKWKINFEVWVVDNASLDNSVEMVKEKFSKVKLIQSEKNLGFSGGNNLALRRIKTKYCLLLNSDTQILDGSIDNLINFMERSSFAIASCKLKDINGRLQPNAGDLPFGFSLFSWGLGIDILPFFKNLPSFHRNEKSFYIGDQEVGWISGSVMLIRIEILDKIGLLDDKIFMYGEDTEYCLRAKKAGLKIGWTDKAKIIHLGGGSLDDPNFRQWLGEFKGLLYIYRKYYGKIIEIVLRLVFIKFLLIRILFFMLTGKSKISKTYAKILFSF